MATKPISLAPLTGVLDLRSLPDLIPQTGVRWRQNLQTVGDGKLRRGTGWTKLLTKANYNNTDFHDQLVTFGAGSRAPVTLLTQAQSSFGTRILFAATQSRIGRLNEYSGNWKILGYGYGGTPSTSAAAPRFRAAAVGDYLAFTNDFDRPLYHILEQVGESGESLYEFEDLEVIGLRRAKLVWEWHNCLFFANVEMDGKHFGYRIVWSDFDNPTSFDPAKAESITGSKDLMANEEILAGEPCGSSFLIYTTRGIWEMTIVGGEQSFSFRRAYNADKNELKAVLTYPNTLVNMGNTHMYLAQEGEAGGVGIYQFTVGMSEPERNEEYHRASALFDQIDNVHCEVHVGAIHGDELLFSIAEVGQTNELPNVTLRINMAYRVCDVVDAGFTAFCNYNSYSVATVRDFMLENEICTLEGITELGYGFTNEGLPRPLPESGADFTPTSIITNVGYPIYDHYYGTYAYVEDWTQTPDAYSLCALTGDLIPDEVCKKCKGETVFVGAASADWCLKQIGQVFYRETCANPTAVGTTDANGYTSALGSYTLDPYSSIMRFAGVFGEVDTEIFSDAFQVDAIAVAQTPPNKIGLRVGISAQPADPNTDECRIVWHQHSLKNLECISQRSAATHRQKNTKPSDTLNWSFIRQGKVLYFELRVDGTGGEATFSRVHANLERRDTRQH